MRKIKVFFHSIVLFKNWWLFVLTRLRWRKEPFTLKFRNGVQLYIPAPVKCVMASYEIFGDEIYTKHCKNPKRVVDIGCGIGDFAIYCAMKGATVYGFDMDAIRIAAAEKNISLNKFTGSVRIEQKEVKLLPDIPCDLLKLDCEGGEYDIILNSPDASFEKIANIAMERHGPPEPLVKRLRDLKYRVLEDESIYIYATRNAVDDPRF